MLRATDTVLGDAGGDYELFATVDLEEVRGVCLMRQIYRAS